MPIFPDCHDQVWEQFPSSGNPKFLGDLVSSVMKGQAQFRIEESRRLVLDHFSSFTLPARNGLVALSVLLMANVTVTPALAKKHKSSSSIIKSETKVPSERVEIQPPDQAKNSADNENDAEDSHLSAQKKKEKYAGYISKAVLPAAPKVEYSESAKELIENSRKLHIFRWSDANKAPKAVIVAVHGTTQHAGSFGVLAQHLVQQGFVFIGLDLRGHGERYYKAFAGQPNFRVDYDKSADDLGALLKKTRATYPGLPIFCIGESVGATVATYMSHRYPGAADGIILCSPGSRPRCFNPLMVVPDFIKGVTHLDEHMDVSRYIDKYSSDDKRVSDEMIADPLSRIKLTPKEVLRTAFFIRTCPKAALEVDPNASYLVIQGEKDGIVSTSSTREIFKNLPAEHKQLIEFKDAGHVLLGTSYLKPQVVDSITNWLASQTDLMRTKVIGLHGEKKEHSTQ